MDAQRGEKPSAEQQNGHGTEQPRSSGLDGLTLFESRVLTALNTLIDQNEEIILLLQGEDDQDGDEPPRHYLNGKPI